MTFEDFNRKVAAFEPLAESCLTAVLRQYELDEIRRTNGRESIAKVIAPQMKAWSNFTKARRKERKTELFRDNMGNKEGKKYAKKLENLTLNFTYNDF